MYKLGTKAEMEALQEELEGKMQPLVESQKDTEAILQAINIGLFILDESYGAKRDWQTDGGYVAVFTEVTQDDNTELLALLKQYNQNPSCMELDRTLTTVLTDCGVIDWLNQVYLIGTEYGITVVRPRLRGRFDERTPRYMSRGIADSLPMVFHEFLYRSIEKMRNKVVLDYLQIFELSLIKEKSILRLKLKHTQERPYCQQETIWDLESTDGLFDCIEKWNGKKLYVIDDDVAITTVFPYER